MICSSSGDHAAALIPLSTLPTTSTCVQCGDVSVGGEEKKKRRTCGLSRARVAMSPPARMMTSERSSGR